jgi:hypothetical protein
MSESRFDFLKDLVKMVPDIASDETSVAVTIEEQHGEGAVPSTRKITFGMSLGTVANVH